MAGPYKLLASQDVLEAYYANVQRSETIHMVILDTDGRIIASNRATAHLFGKTPEELIGTNWIDISVPQQQQPGRKSAYKRLLATNLPEVEQTSIRQPDGSIRTLIWSHTLMRTDESLSGILSFGIDVTEQEREHAQLAQEQQLLMRAESIAGLGMYTLDTTTGLWTSSRVLDKIFGITDSYPRTARGWLELVHPDDRSVISDYFSSHVLMRHNPFDKVYRIVRKSDDEVRIIHGFGEIESSVDGKVSRLLLGAIQDITDQERVDKQLLESEERFRALVQNSPDTIVTIDADTGKFVDVNPRAEKLFGMHQSDLLLISPADVSPPAQPDGRPSPDASREYIQQAVDGKKPTFKWVHRSAQGVDKLCLIRFISLPYRHRQLVRGSITDVSEIKDQIRLLTGDLDLMEAK